MTIFWHTLLVKDLVNSVCSLLLVPFTATSDLCTIRFRFSSVIVGLLKTHDAVNGYRRNLSSYGFVAWSTCQWG